jgi:hypothetical protein
MRHSIVRRISALFLLTALLLSSCSGGKGSGGVETTEPAPSYTVEGWITPSTVKNVANAPVPEKKATDLEVDMVKNESESIQLSFYCNDRVDGFTVSVEGDTDGIQFKYFLEETVSVKGEKWPDALVPLSGEFFLPRRVTRTVLVTLVTESTTKAGERSLVFKLNDGNGKTVCTFNVELTVWDITLNDSPAMTSFVITYKDAIAKHHGYGQDLSKLSSSQMAEVDALYKKYYDLLLDYGISGGTLPYDILDDRADAYMSDPRVTSFQVDQWASDATLVAIYNKLKTNPEWLDKAVIYVQDEPSTAEHYAELESRLDRLEAVCPEIKTMITFFSDLWYDSEIDTVQYILNRADVAVASFACFNPSFLYKDTTLASTQRPLKDRIEDYKAEGNNCWTYITWEPGKPYNNLYVNEEGLDHRILFWQMYDFGSEGFLYWASNYWLETGDPWVNQLTVPWLSMNVYGDGSLLYNGNKVGIDGACASLRLDLIRDGMEDYALLSLAMEVLGEKKTSSIIDKVTRGITTYTGSDEVFFGARADLCKAIAQALSDE